MRGTGNERIQVEGLVKDFRPGLGLRARRVPNDVSFSVREGEIYGFVGPNGAGKTTTLKILMGLIRPTAGQATILGHPVSQSSFRQEVGFLPENPYFYSFLTAREILDFYARLSGIGSSVRKQKIAELLSSVGLEHAGDARLKTFSKGMLQRVGIAQALVHDPSVVFLDEPMSGLDPIGRKEIRDIILKLRAEGRTVFMNTHILTDVEMICDRVAIIVKGHIRYEGPIADLLRDDNMDSDVVLSRLPSDLGIRLQERYGSRVKGMGDRIEIRVPDKDVNSLLNASLGAGAEVVSVTRNRHSLEHAFLSAVQDRDTPAVNQPTELEKNP
ncbi:MAG: ABC transporter ATP-binding protein [Myxococcota bacterium]|nr:ABC transporter ATP-binding protein [Myxococcota bacterium]